MRYLLLCAALLLSWPAAAVVTPLPGASGQHNFTFVSFPNVIGVRVTTASGAPAPGAEVTFTITDGVLLSNNRVGSLGRLEGQLRDSVCQRVTNSVTTCVVVADGDGVATIPPAHGTVAGRYVIVVTARFGTEVSVGSIELIADPQFQPLTLSVVSGTGLLFAPVDGVPVRIAVKRPNGTPAAGLDVLVCADARYAVFRAGSESECVTVRTDVSGAATTPALHTIAPGNYALYLRAFDAFAAAYAEAESLVYSFQATAPPFTGIDMQGLWWGGPSQDGWGLSIVQHDARFFMVLFVYDQEGQATWFVAPDGRWRGGQPASSIESRVYRANGSPYFNYDASSFRLSDPFEWTTQVLRRPDTRTAPFEALTVGWLSHGSASLGGDFILRNYLTNYAVVPIMPQSFAGTTASPITGVADMWWGGPGQAGWGVAIHEQFGGLFSVWFTYDFYGIPIWFVMPGGTWVDSRTYAGDVFRTSSSAFGYLGQTYNASLLRASKVGTYRLVFSDRFNATMHYDVEGHVGSNALQRQPF
jgi:hypothetical protein